MFKSIPVWIVLFWATSPIKYGIIIAPKEATGSIIPMLFVLIIRPALATAVGFIPAMENAKRNKRIIANTGVDDFISSA